jgi:hypothetical protein
MEDLQLLVRNAGNQGNPVGFTRRGTVMVIRLSSADCASHRAFRSRAGTTYKTNGMHASAIHPDLVPKGGELPHTVSGPGQ